MTMIRPFRDTDIDAVVDLSLRAWEPVFTSWRQVLGERIYALAYPDWHKSQAETVRSSCTTHAETTVIAELDGQVVGFAVVVLGEPDGQGIRAADLEMIAVDPQVHRCGVGRSLMDHAMGMMRDAGCVYVNVWTGGDKGHAPARAMYEASGFTALPVVHYYREL